MAQKVDLSQQNIYGLPVVYTRTNGQPMEETLIWDSYSAAVAYAKTSKAYVGQILSVITDAGEGKSPRYTSKAYIVNSEAGDLVEISGKSNHYTPVKDDTVQLNAVANSSTAATWGTTDLVTGVSLQRDAKGHVTGVTVSSVQMPSDPTTGLNECEGKVKIGTTWYECRTGTSGAADKITFNI